MLPIYTLEVVARVALNVVGVVFLAANAGCSLVVDKGSSGWWIIFRNILVVVPGSISPLCPLCSLRRETSVLVEDKGQQQQSCTGVEDRETPLGFQCDSPWTISLPGDACARRVHDWRVSLLGP